MRLLSAIIAIACVASARGQRIDRRQAQQCITPENYYGTCVTLTYCPQVVNIFQTTSQRVAQQYVFALQRACGTRSVNGDPVICCTRPTQATRAPVTQAPNPFFTAQPTRPTFVQPTLVPTRIPTNPFLNTPAPTRAPAPTPRPTTAPRPPTSAPLIEPKTPNCRGPDVVEGTCIDLTRCQVLIDQLYEKPNDAEFASFLRASRVICGGTGTNVCCPLATRQTQTSTSSPVRNYNEIPRTLPTEEDGCGYTTNSFKKIVGGEVSKRGAWPWVTLLGYDDEISGSPFKCGGALVTARHVVTAAHCIRDDLTFVRLGEHDLGTDAEAQHVDVKVVRKESHPEYNRRNGRSDIALLYLERNVQFNDYILPVCLPYASDKRSKSYVDYTPFVVGWGRTMEGGASASILQELQIPIFSNEVCKDRYMKQNRLFSSDQFDSAVICAGVLSGGKDTCQGDSGGPLMIPEPYKNNVRYYLIGVVSYGIGCARPEVPGVYSSTQHFIDWIVQKISETS